jgi:intracellular sulfur oxidation DsrE/DsrF family protein
MPTLPRRSFLSRFGLGLTAGGVTLGSGVASAQAPATQDGKRFQPARYPQDEWYDQIRGKHRFVFDSTSPEAASLGLNFISNFFTASQAAYGLKDEDLAVIFVMRHSATPFAYNDAMWQKYGVAITSRTKYNDPTTNKPPTVNIYNTVREEGQQTGRTVSALTARGVQLAVCQLSTRAYAGAIATATGQKQETVFEELKANLIGTTNARLVPAGILAVNRAQEHGYTFAFAS